MPTLLEILRGFYHTLDRRNRVVFLCLLVAIIWAFFMWGYHFVGPVFNGWL